MLVDIAGYDTTEVLGVVEHGAYGLQCVLKGIHHLLTLSTCLGLDTADSSCDAALRDYLEHADTACGAGMDATTELTRGTEAHDADRIAILLAEEGYGSKLLCLLKWCVTMLVEREVLTYHAVH